MVCLFFPPQEGGWDTILPIITYQYSSEKIKDKEKILKEAGEKKTHLTYREIRIMSDFSLETMQTRREWSEIFKVLKEKINQPTSNSVFCKSKRKIKTFSEKSLSREFIISRPGFQETLQKILRKKII